MGNEERFERLIELALDAQVESSDDPLRAEEELRVDGIEPHTFSPAFERKMERLIRRQRRAAWCEKHGRTVKRIAASAALFVVVAGVTVLSVDAFRVPVMRFVLDLTGTHSEIVIDTEKTSISKEFDPYLPSYVPAGFTVGTVQEYEGEGISIEYVNEDEQFYGLRFDYVLSGASIDTEDAQIEEITIQGFPALVTEKKGRMMISCGINGHAYYVTGYISKEEAIKILESVQ